MFQIAIDQSCDSGVGPRFQVLRPYLLGDFFFGFATRELVFEQGVDIYLSAEEHIKTKVEVPFL
jgi:hypothetical protein